jgi:hypothetical protein
MKLTFAAVLCFVLSVLIFASTTSPHHLSQSLIRFIILFLILSLLLSVCIFPWLKGTFNEKLLLALQLSVILSMACYSLGYITFSITTLM